MPESSCGVKKKNGRSHVGSAQAAGLRSVGLHPYDIIDFREASDHQLVSIWILVLYRLSGRVGFSELQKRTHSKEWVF